MDDKLAEAIAQLAQRLGIEAARVWPQMVAMTWTQALVGLVTNTGVLVLILGLGLWLARRWWRAKKDDGGGGGDDSDAVFLFGMAASLVAIVCLISAIVYLSWLPDAIAALAYPEPTTIRDLLRAVK